MKKYILLIAFSQIFSTNYYVSLTGDDFNGDGTESNPYRSISRAIIWQVLLLQIMLIYM